MSNRRVDVAPFLLRAEVTCHLTRAYLYNTSVKFTTVCWLTLTVDAVMAMAMAMAALVLVVAALVIAVAALETGRG